MRAQLRKQLVNLALVLAAVGAVTAVVLTTGRVTTEERELRADNLLPAWRGDDVTRVSVEREGKATVIEQGPADDAGEREWRLTSPIAEGADAYGVDQLLRSLEFARVVRRIKPEQVDRAAFGLEAPRWRLEIEMGAIRYRLAIGAEAASPAGATYVELSGVGVPTPGVALVAKELLPELSAGLTELRSKLLLPYLSIALSKLSLAGEGGERRLRREGKLWRFDGERGDRRVSREALDSVLLQLARLNVEQFLDAQEVERQQRGAGVVTVTQTPEDPAKPPGVLIVGGACPGGRPGVLARRVSPDPLAGCVPDSVMAGLTLPAERLEDASAVGLRRDEIESLSVELGGRKLVMDRLESRFELREPTRAEVSLEAGNERLEHLVAARGQRVEAPDLAALGLQPPRGTLTVRSAAESEHDVVEERVALGRVDATGRLAVRREVDGVVLELSRDEARAFTPDAALVRSRSLLPFRPAEVTRVELSGQQGRQVLEHRAGGESLLLQPKGYAVDAAGAQELIEALAGLNAERWVADEDDGSFGLQRAPLSVTVSVGDADAGSKTYELRVGDASLSGSYGSLRGEPGVFLLARRTVALLDTLLIDRSVFSVPAEQLQGVTLSAGPRRLRLVRSGDGFSAVASELPSSRIGPLVDALLTLRAEAALHLGAARPDEGFGKPLLEVELSRRDGGKLRFEVGAGDTWRELAIHYARVDGIAATYLLPRSRVRLLLDAL